MSQPWMPLYVGDYLADTGRLSTLEHGAYMLLIMDYWRNGSLPDDDRKLARIARMTEQEWAAVRDNLADMFLSGWRHKRIDEELAEAQKRSDTARNAANKRWQAGRNADALPEDADPHAESMPSQPQPQLKGDRDREARVREEYDEFYLTYPKHENRKTAWSRYATARKAGVSHDRIMAGLARWVSTWAADGTEDKFKPAPDVWLNKAKYDDDPKPSARDGPDVRAPSVSSRHESQVNGTPKSPTDFLRSVIRTRVDDREAEDRKLLSG